MRKLIDDILSYRRLASLTITLLTLLSLILLTTISDNKLYNSKNPSIINGSKLENPESPIGMYARSSSPIWDRENAYINTNVFYRQGMGPELKSKFQKEGVTNAKAIKVLIFGDSFIWGHGLADGQKTISNMLQSRLDDYAGEGVFNVITYGESGDSTYRYVDIFNKEKIHEINPDVVLYAFFENDLIPTFNESLICKKGLMCDRFNPQTFPEYKNCAIGHSSLFSRLSKYLVNHGKIGIGYELLTRHCDIVLNKIKSKTYDEYRIQKHPGDNPWLPIWNNALKILKKNMGDRNFGVVNLVSVDNNSNNNYKFYENSFIKSGIEAINMQETRKFIASAKSNGLISSKLRANPSNGHSSAMLNNKFVEDTMVYLKKKYPYENLPILKNDLYSDSDIVKLTLPNAVKITQNGVDEFTASLPVLRADLAHPLSVAGKKLLPQDVSCALLNHSHIMLSIAKNYSNKSFTVYPAGGIRADNKLQLTLYYYDQEYDLKLLGTGLIKGKLVVTPPLNNKGILLLVGDPNENKGCSTNSEIKHYPFVIRVKY